MPARMVKSADTADLKSADPKRSWGFKSPSGHQINSNNDNDAKVRRQSIDPEDLIHAHIGGVDLCARAFLVAARLFEEGPLAGAVKERYAGWCTAENQAMLNGKLTLEAIAAKAESEDLDPAPRSGRQERLENLVSSYC
jgi:xylose isomerase